MMRRLISLALSLSFLAFMALPAAAAAFFFSTGNPDGLMAAASRPSGAFEIEAADDFVTSDPTTLISGANFTGLLPSGTLLSDITQIVVKIYRVFPMDSNIGRTLGPPTFSTSQVPTRVNSPSDVAFDSRDSSASGLTFTAAIISSSFTTNNSVTSGGIHPIPNQTTAGNGPATGEEVSFNVAFTPSFRLPADHYFFVPQVQLTSGDFLWLSAPRPIVPPGTPFPPGNTDLQSWTRDTGLVPDWLRVGTDIVGGGGLAPTFNFSFSLTGFVLHPTPGLDLLLLD
jgi:hypothetical protein